MPRVLLALNKPPLVAKPQTSVYPKRPTSDDAESDRRIFFCLEHLRQQANRYMCVQLVRHLTQFPKETNQHVTLIAAQTIPAPRTR